MNKRRKNELTAREASILGLIASTRDLSPVEYRRLLAELSPDAREVAAALVFLKHNRKAHRVTERPSADAEETARALLAWA